MYPTQEHSPPLFEEAQKVTTWPLDQVLLILGNVFFTIRHLLTGVFICGASGSGKTSASLRAIVHACLEAGISLVFYPIKREDAEMYRRWVEECGRIGDYCELGPGQCKINALDYLLNHPEPGVSDQQNVTRRYREFSTSNTTGSGAEDSTFWDGSQNTHTTQTFCVLRHSGEPVAIDDVRAVIHQAARSLKEAATEAWRDTDVLGRRLAMAKARTIGTQHERAVRIAEQFFAHELPKQPERSRACVEMAMLNFCTAFDNELLHDVFCTETTLIPEQLINGGPSICLVNFPILQYPTIGPIAHRIWKTLSHQALEMRPGPRDDTCKPLITVADECQYQIGDTGRTDGMFSTISRSARVGQVAATQNLPNLVSAMGGPNAETAVRGWIGNFGTRIYHAQGEAMTCQFIAEEIGRCRKFQVSGGDDSRFGISRLLAPQVRSDLTVSSSEEFAVRPEALRRLRCGGPANKYLVDGLVVMNSMFGNENAPSFLPVVFQQEPAERASALSPCQPTSLPTRRRSFWNRLFNSGASEMTTQDQPSSGSNEPAFPGNGSKMDALIPYHDKIVAWREEQLDLRAIAAKVKAAGCKAAIDHNTVHRYIHKHILPLATPAGAESKGAVSNEQHNGAVFSRPATSASKTETPAPTSAPILGASTSTVTPPHLIGRIPKGLKLPPNFRSGSSSI